VESWRRDVLRRIESAATPVSARAIVSLVVVSGGPSVFSLCATTGSGSGPASGFSDLGRSTGEFAATVIDSCWSF
jgi:hypothetical protein